MRMVHLDNPENEVPKPNIDWADKFNGVLLGMAVGDAIGLPREGLSERRAGRMFGSAPLRHRFFFGRGMVSDDTEHACMTAQALLASRGEATAFGRSLGWRLRGWLLAIPAGIGFGTLRAILKLWIGFGPQRSGVRSAGNGPAMRAPILGVWMAAVGMSEEGRAKLLRSSTRITHTDERALEGAMLIAVATARAAVGGPGVSVESRIDELQVHAKGVELRESLMQMRSCLARGASTAEFAKILGLEKGVSGYINHTVPMALYCHLRWPNDFRRAVEEAVITGGDTDTVAGIVGGMSGAALGAGAIPKEWVVGLMEWPRSVGWMHALGGRMAEQTREMRRSMGRLSLFWPGLLMRNFLFILIVLTHGLRRLFPPY